MQVATRTSTGKEDDVHTRLSRLGVTGGSRSQVCWRFLPVREVGNAIKQPNIQQLASIVGDKTNHVADCEVTGWSTKAAGGGVYTIGFRSKRVPTEDLPENKPRENPAAASVPQADSRRKQIMKFMC